MQTVIQLKGYELLIFILLLSTSTIHKFAIQAKHNNKYKSIVEDN